MLGLVLVTSDFGITDECIVRTSQSILPQRIFAHFVRQVLVQKRKVWHLRTFCGTNSHNRQAENQPEVGHFQK